jgi:hypothetical protein
MRRIRLPTNALGRKAGSRDLLRQRVGHLRQFGDEPRNPGPPFSTNAPRSSSTNCTVRRDANQPAIAIRVTATESIHRKKPSTICRNAVNASRRSVPVYSSKPSCQDST